MCVALGAGLVPHLERQRAKLSRSAAYVRYNRAMPTFYTVDKHIVRAAFKPGGTQYHYRCEGAHLGDKIHAPGKGLATVVGYGRNGSYHDPVRYAVVMERKNAEGSISHAIRHEMAGLQATIPIKTHQSFPHTISIS